MQNSNTHSQEGLHRSAYDLKYINFHTYKGFRDLGWLSRAHSWESMYLAVQKEEHVCPQILQGSEAVSTGEKRHLSPGPGLLGSLTVNQLPNMTDFNPVNLLCPCMGLSSHVSCNTDFSQVEFKLKLAILLKL